MITGFFILLGTLALYFAITYNRLVRVKNLVAEGWSGIDVQLKRRADLIPNLVQVVRSYSKHESTVLQDLTTARSNAGNASPSALASSEQGVTTGLKQLLAIAEAYPNLKADTNFRQLHTSLIEVEDHLQFARRYYNGAVRDLNTLAQSVPSNIVASLCGFKPREFFEVESATERATPNVSL